MPKLTANLKAERDEMALQLMEATCDSRYNRSRMIKGSKYYLLTYATGKDAMDALAKAEKKGNFIAKNFPYSVIVLKDEAGRGLAEIWVRRK